MLCLCVVCVLWCVNVCVVCVFGVCVSVLCVFFVCGVCLGVFVWVRVCGVCVICVCVFGGRVCS